MSKVPTIIDLEKVIEGYLIGGKVVSYTSQYLPKPADNFGSILLAIKAKVTYGDDDNRTLSLVAKIPAGTNEYLWKVLKPERTFLAENAAYLYLSPAYRHFQKENGICQPEIFDCFAKFYGSRISLNSKANEVDHNAVLVMENFQTLGYRVGNREMLDYRHARVIIKHLAKFHALGIAMRLKKPKEFLHIIRPYFRRRGFVGGEAKKKCTKYEEYILSAVAEATKQDKRILRRIAELLNDYRPLGRLPEKINDPYTTMVHFNLTVNNIMIKYDSKNLFPCAVKFIDFQQVEYESLSYDVIFFIFSTLQAAVIEDYVNELLLMYYNVFMKCLRDNKAPTDGYSFIGLMKELYKYAPVAICGCLLAIPISVGDDNVLAANFDNPSAQNSKLKKLTIQRTADIIRLAQKYLFLFSAEE